MNYYIFIIITIMAILNSMIFSKIFIDTTWKMTIIICNIGFYFYSGLGIAILNLNFKYILPYFVTEITLNVGLLLGWIILKKKRVSYASHGGYEKGSSNISKLLQNNIGVIKLITIIYYIIIFASLIYPENKLVYLFTAPNIDLNSAINMQYTSSTNTLQHLLSTFQIFATPFVIAYFYSKRKKRYVIFYVLFNLLVSYLSNNAYIGRRDIIVAILLIDIYLYANEKSKKKKIKIILCTILLVIPLIWIYAIFKYIRAGISINVFGFTFIDSIKEFINDEAVYPKHYDLAYALYLQGAYSPKTFWYWLLTLPIPKEIFSMPGYDIKTTIIYRVFSYYYFGGLWGDQGVGGVLPSIMGEGIMIFGINFCFVLMIPVSIFIGFYMKFLNNIPELKFYKYTILMTFLLGFRAGSQYILANINGFIAIIYVLVFIKLYNGIKKKFAFKIEK